MSWAAAALLASCGNSEDPALQSEAGSGGASPAAGATSGGAAAVSASGAAGSNTAPGGTVAGSGGSAGAGGDRELCPFLPSRGSDVASRLTGSSGEPIARAPTLVSTTVLDGAAVIEGELSSTSDRMPFLLANDAGCSASSSTDWVNVHAVELVGEGPHQVVFETSAGADVVLGEVFQSLGGEPSALDLDAPCAHWLGSIEEWTGAGYRLVASGLAQGTVLIAVKSYEDRSYTISVSSSTSCTGSAREITPGVDAASTPFVDPNPMACTASDLRRCDAGASDPTGGEVEWTDCCLTDFIQNPEGKCGLSGNGSACMERQQPGNLDDSCPAGSLQYSFPPNTLRGDGYPCCNWRTGLCGLMNPNDALDLGCSPMADYGAPAEQPCTPDYSAGIIF